MKPYIPPHPRQEPKYDMPVTAENVMSVFRDAADFFARRVLIGGCQELPAWVFFIDGLTSGGDISDFVVEPLMRCHPSTRDPDQALDWLAESVIYSCTGEIRTTMDRICSGLVNGFVIILPEGQCRALALEAKTGEKRGISEPSIENTVKGAKDAFVETVRTNTSLVRRHLRTPELRIQEQIVGRQTLTNVSILYISNLTNMELVESLKKRLESMDIDGLLSTNTLEEYLFGSSSMFPRLVYTERSDRFCHEIMGGRVGLLVDGMPLGFLLPATLSQIMKTPEDRSANYIVASCVRLLRYLALVVTLLLPGTYLAVRLYHSDMLPPLLLRAILESKEKVAAGTAFEVMSLLISFELLQEAGLRLPQNIGQTLGVIGGLVVGTAAVDASLISPAVLVMVSLAGIAGYTLPNQDFSNAVRVWRFVIAVLAWILGLYGVLLGCLALVAQLAGISTFGVNYLTPFGSGDAGRILRTVAVEPARSDIYRQPELRTVNKRSKGQ